MNDMTFQQWFDLVQPVPNEIANTPTACIVDGVPYLFETNGKEHNHVWEIAQKHPDLVWTLVECDEVQYLSKGYHFVNRLGYFIASKPLKDKSIDEIFYAK